MKLKSSQIIILSVIVLGLVFALNYRKEGYEPHNMGSRRYWGFGRQNAYSVLDHHEDHGPCYQSGQREHKACLPGYTRYVNRYSDQVQCCVNLSNY